MNESLSIFLLFYLKKIYIKKKSVSIYVRLNLILISFSVPISCHFGDSFDWMKSKFRF